MLFFLHQKHGGVASCVGHFTCTNGCCRNNPCLNGGTCNEICEPTSVRYNCSCPEPFVGKHCREIQPRSCQDYKAAGVDKSGLYKIIDNTNLTLQVFCDFSSEPGFAWNLVESFSLSNKDLFQVNILNKLEEIERIFCLIYNLKLEGLCTKTLLYRRNMRGISFKKLIVNQSVHKP